MLNGKMLKKMFNIRWKRRVFI